MGGGPVEAGGGPGSLQHPCLLSALISPLQERVKSILVQQIYAQNVPTEQLPS